MYNQFEYLFFITFFWTIKILTVRQSVMLRAHSNYSSVLSAVLRCVLHNAFQNLTFAEWFHWFSILHWKTSFDAFLVSNWLHSFNWPCMQLYIMLLARMRIYATRSGTSSQCSSVFRNRDKAQSNLFVLLDHPSCCVQHSLQLVRRHFRSTC